MIFVHLNQLILNEMPQFALPDTHTHIHTEHTHAMEVCMGKSQKICHQMNFNAVSKTISKDLLRICTQLNSGRGLPGVGAVPIFQ